MKAITHNSKRKYLIWLFFTILILIILIYPLYGHIWRSKYSFLFTSMFSQIVNSIGNTMIILGGIILVWGILMILCSHSGKGIKLMVQGVLIMIAGAILIDFNFNTFFSLFNESMTSGYH